MRGVPRINDPLTHERLLELLHYDPETGVWRWLLDRNQLARAGSIAGTIDCRNNPTHGYRTIWVDGRQYLSSRLAVFYMTGEWPTHLVDHRNNKHGDDHWSNLRPATHAQNNQNRKLPSNNTSGYKGVSFHKQHRKWQAQFRCNGERSPLGFFTTKEEAAIAIAEASEQLHGEFAHKESMLPHRRLLAAKREREFEAWCRSLSPQPTEGVRMSDVKIDDRETQGSACPTNEAAHSCAQVGIGE